MLAKQIKGTALRSLSHNMDLEWMREAYRRTRKDGAVGVDGVTASEFAANLDLNLQELLDRAPLGPVRANAGIGDGLRSFLCHGMEHHADSA
jgi:hypothetical protein